MIKNNKIALLNPVLADMRTRKHTVNKELRRDNSFINVQYSASNEHAFLNKQTEVYFGNAFSKYKSLNIIYYYLLKLSGGLFTDEEFFSYLKNDLKKLTKVEFDEEIVREQIEALRANNQTWAAARMDKDLTISQAKNLLLENGFCKIVTEETLIKFVKKSKKGLCLRPIESFTYEIPQEVQCKFKKAEELEIFDNYYILHYDPKVDKNPFYEGVKEPKDPIMFGVLVGSSDLYFIADWISDYCDLTLEKFNEIINESK